MPVRSSAHLWGADLQGADLRGAHLWRVLLDEEEDLGDRWVLADLRGVGIEPTEEADERGARKPMENVEGFIDGVLQEIEHNDARERVREQLRHGLIEGDRPEVPRFPEGWRATPRVVFEPDDPLAQQPDRFWAMESGGVRPNQLALWTTLRVAHKGPPPPQP